jgi:NTE family protein
MHASAARISSVRDRIGVGILPAVSGEGLPREEPREGVRRALVLSGGGARGSYEAGVMQYVFTELPERLGFVPRIDLYCGTSVGAVHACYLAAHADRISEGARSLSGIWREMAFSRVYRFGLSDALTFSRTMLDFLSGRRVDLSSGPDRLHGLLNTTPLERLVVNHIPWLRLRRNLRRRVVDTLCVSATEIRTGRTIVFADNADRRVPEWTHDPFVVPRATRVGPEHVLASAAIPFLFPAVKIGDRYHCDGGLRQITPLSPALRFGANRLLAVGLRSPRVPEVADRLGRARLEHFVSAGFLLGKVLDALLIDRIEYDLANMRIINQLLTAGIEVEGPDHLERVNQRVRAKRGIGFQVVEDCLISPSEDLGAIAATHVARMRKEGSGSWVGGLALRALTRGAPEEEADLMSYLLFDGAYASDLIELGLQDARRAEEDLVRFFTA